MGILDTSFSRIKTSQQYLLQQQQIQLHLHQQQVKQEYILQQQVPGTILQFGDDMTPQWEMKLTT